MAGLNGGYGSTQIRGNHIEKGTTRPRCRANRTVPLSVLRWFGVPRRGVPPRAPGYGRAGKFAGTCQPFSRSAVVTVASGTTIGLPA